ncbi:hypothetical protein ACHAWF_008356 [Thalassiosira exigua]
MMGVAACLIVGYVLGSAKSTISTMASLNKGVKIVSTNRTRKYDISTTATATITGNHTDKKMMVAGQASTSASSVIEEIIPPKLLPLYALDKLRFNVTRSMLRQSRPIVGNTQRLHLYLNKLRSRTCTSVLFLGGSGEFSSASNLCIQINNIFKSSYNHNPIIYQVTGGHNGGGPTAAFPKRTMDWLNERYPCVTSNGTQGMHVRKDTHIGDSRSAFVLWSSITSIEEFDAVFLEFNIGDAFGNDVANALEDKGPGANTIEYHSGWYFEVVLRRLSILRKPDPVAIITFNADYIGRKWAMPPWFDPKEARKMIFRANTEPTKLWVSSIYEIPVFSAVIWMLPLSMKKGRDWQFNRTENPYSTSAWHADACCHPPAQGHLILTLVIAYCMVEEEKIMMSYNEFDTAEGEHDFTMDTVPILRTPLYLSPEEDDMYVWSKTEAVADFSDPNGEKDWKNIVAANEGWSWYADNKYLDKFGLIAGGDDGGQHLALKLSGKQHGRVDVTYVISYENFGVALVWLDESTENVHKQTFCNGKTEGKMPQQLNAIWGAQASLPTNALLTERLKDGEEKVLHICLMPRSKNQKGTKNKFKLLSITVY